MMNKNTQVKASANYQMIWRWHFYAGLFCIPFILWLSVTGSIYLFKPQIDSYFDNPYNHLDALNAKTPVDQVHAVLNAMPDASLYAFQLSESSTQATQILIKKSDKTYRVYVHPESLKILKVQDEEAKLTNLIFYLHGELLLGNYGSFLVELAASWTVMLIVTGIYLWWPQGSKSFAGVLYPRFKKTGRLFWKDLHSVIAFWVSIFTLFLILSGLPWAKSWGSILEKLRETSIHKVVQADWKIGHDNQSKDNPKHQGHMADKEPSSATQPNDEVLNIIIKNIKYHKEELPILIYPPSPQTKNWTVKSETQNRPLRYKVEMDPNSGKMISREDFKQSPLIDQVVETGVAAHEGQLFGWPNLLLGLLTTFGLIISTISAIVMWLSRRHKGSIGAPKTIANNVITMNINVVIIALSLLLPLLGISLILIKIIEQTILKRVPVIKSFLGI